MSDLMELVKRTPSRVVGPRDWFASLAQDAQQEIRELLQAKLDDPKAFPHSFVQLAEIVVERYQLDCSPDTVRMRLTQITRKLEPTCESAPKRSRKK